MAELSLSSHVVVIAFGYIETWVASATHENRISNILRFGSMNEDQTKQTGSFAPRPNATSISNLRSLEAKHGRRHLVEFLISRKQMQIAAQKHAPASVTH